MSGKKSYKEPDYRTQAIMAAKDFHYGDDVIKQIEEAKTNDEIILIMGKARRKKFG